MSTIGIIVSSTRPERVGHKVADWVAQNAPAGTEAKVLDLMEINLPFLNDLAVPRTGEYDKEHTKRWSETVKGVDAFIIVTPEYNGFMTPALLNAIDSLYQEWVGKKFGVVGYGFGGAGRAIGHIKELITNVEAAVVEPTVGLFFNQQVAMTGEVSADEVSTQALQDLYSALA